MTSIVVQIQASAELLLALDQIRQAIEALTGSRPPSGNPALTRQAETPTPAATVDRVPAAVAALEPVAASFEAIRGWAFARGIQMNQIGDLSIVNKKRAALGLPPFAVFGAARINA